MRTEAWTGLMPLHCLPTYVDFRFTGTAISSLESLGRLCQSDNDLMDVVEKAQAIERARPKASISTVPSPPPR